MAARSDDHVPGTATSGDDDPEADTAAKKVPDLVDGIDQDDPTVQSTVPEEIHRAARNAGIPVPMSRAAKSTPGRPAPPAPPMRITSKKMTAVGLGGPLPAVSPSSTSMKAAKEEDSEADAVDDTATAPAPRVVAPPPVPPPPPGPGPKSNAKLPISVPNAPVKIRDGDEPLDDTEIRTLITKGHLPKGAKPPPNEQPTSKIPDLHAKDDDDDEPDDSVTTQAPSPLSARLPEDDEPKTSPPMTAPLGPRLSSQEPLLSRLPEDKSASPLRPRAPLPAAGKSPSQSLAAAAAAAVARTEANAAARQQTSASPSTNDAYEADESVTTRGPAIDYVDDSVTAQAPAVGAPGSPAFEETGGTTNRLGAPPARPRGMLESVGDDPISVTAEAPAPNLRVVPNVDDEEDANDSMEGSTAVMINAPGRTSSDRVPTAAPVGVAALLGHAHSPARPPARLPLASTLPLHGNRAAAIADLREPISDSGLRVASVDDPLGEHANLDALMNPSAHAQHGMHVPMQQERGSGIGRTAPASGGHVVDHRGPNPFAKTEQAFVAPAPRGRVPSLREIDFGSTVKKPRYGLLVILVGLASFAIPLLLFLLLHNPTANLEPHPRAPAEAASDPVVRGDPPRVKAKASTSPAPPPTPINNGGFPPPPQPQRKDGFTGKRK